METSKGYGITEACVDTYLSSRTGLGAEIVVYYDTPEEASGDDREWFIDKRPRFVLLPLSLFRQYRKDHTGSNRFPSSAHPTSHRRLTLATSSAPRRSRLC
jgi:hypothetical protein